MNSSTTPIEASAIRGRLLLRGRLEARRPKLRGLEQLLRLLGGEAELVDRPLPLERSAPPR